MLFDAVLLKNSDIEGSDCRCSCEVCMAGGASVLLSDVRRDSGGDIRPDIVELGHPADEYGGGG